MAPRWIQTFNALYRKLPFADTARTNLRIWVEAVRRAFAVDPPGYAVSLDGVNDYVVVPHSVAWGANEGLNILNAISIECWVYWKNTGVDIDFICSKGPGIYEIHTAVGGVTANSLRFIPMGTVNIDTAVNRFPSNTWNHVVVTWSDATRVGKIYINGVDTLAVKSLDTGGVLAASVLDFNIGRRQPGTFPFKGYIDEFRVWGRELSAAEVTELYAAGAGFYLDDAEVASGVGYAYELRAYWRFDEGTGVAAEDEAPTNADGTLMLGATWTTGKVLRPTSFQTGVNRVYDAAFLPYARNLELDAWGAVIRDTAGALLTRTLGESDPAYRTRQLAAWQATVAALTVDAITDAVNAAAVAFVPPLTVTRIDEYYKDRLEDGVAAADTWSLGDRWGLHDLDLLSFAVVLSRIPTPAETLTLAAVVESLKAAQTCGYLVNQLATLPISYRARAKIYSQKVMDWIWDDNFLRAAWMAAPDVRDYYNTFGEGGVMPVWQYSLGTEIWGVGANGVGGGVPMVCVPRQNLKRFVFDERDIYIDALLKIVDFGMGPGSAGLALRYDDVNNELYAVMFAGLAPGCNYTVYHYDPIGGWTVIAGPTVIAADMSVYQRVQCTLEDKYLTLIVGGVVLENRLDIGTTLTAPGRWGLCIDDVNVDLYADELKYW